MRCPQLGTPHEVSTFFDTVLGDRLKILRALNRYIYPFCSVTLYAQKINAV